MSHNDKTPDRQVILCVDDDPEYLDTARVLLERHGYGVLLAQTADAALHLFAFNHVNLVLLDYDLGRVSGWPVARAMKRVKPQVPISWLTAHRLLPEKVMSAAEGFYCKLDGPEVLLSTLHALLSPPKM